MHILNEIDELEIFVLMDNVSDPFSESNQGKYWNESQYQSQILKRNEYCGADCCRACNGLSLYIKIKAGEQHRTILFDTGPDAGLVVDNAKKLGLTLSDVEAIVLSHGHFDHYGGTISVLDAVNKSNLPVYAHPDVFLPRAFGENEKTYVSYTITREEIKAHGGNVIESTEPVSILDSMALISGEVPRTTGYEAGMPGEFKLNNKTWAGASDVIDEQCLILNLKNKGLVVITGCGHTGVVNAVKHAKHLLAATDVYLVMGGLHLAQPSVAERINPTIEDLQAIQPHYLVTGHCTGRQTQALLSHAFGERHIPYGVGARFLF